MQGGVDRHGFSEGALARLGADLVGLVDGVGVVVDGVVEVGALGVVESNDVFPISNRHLFAGGINLIARKRDRRLSVSAIEQDRSDDLGINYGYLWLDRNKLSCTLGGEYVLYRIGKIGFLRVVEGNNIPAFFDGIDSQFLAELCRF